MSEYESHIHRGDLKPEPMPSDFDSLREDIATVADSLARYSSTVGRATGSHDLEIRKLWADNAELRDELHAVANRLENLTRAVTTDAAEVAAGIVNDANRNLRVACVDYDPVTGETVRRRDGDE